MTFSGNMKESKPRGKDSWESELGYGWTRSGQQRCARHRAPESTMSVSSDIRFTRRKLSRGCRGCCAAVASLLVLLLLAAVAVYLGHMYLFGDPLNRQTFRGSFVVSTWPEGAEVVAKGKELVPKGNRTRESQLQQTLYNLYQNSELRSCFVSADILALDSVEEGTRVHFEVSFEPIFTAVSTSEVTNVLARELTNPTDYFDKFITQPNTLQIEENSMISSLELKETETTPIEPPTTEPIVTELVEEVRECLPVSLSLCSHLPYNSSSYPNLVGHASSDALMRDLVAFRELLDAECSHLAQDFVCQMLQPRCDADRLVRPCRAYCRAFHAGCGSRLPDRLRPHFDCSRFPDYFGKGSCAPEPDCRGGLQRLALSRRACDGTPDCADARDERECAHCAAAAAGGSALRCALHARCLPAHLRCDGTPDCPDGSDESGCLWITRSLASWRRENSETTLGAVRSRAGYAVWAERGRDGKICAEPYDNDKKALISVATSLCRALTYKSAISAEVVPDAEEIDEDGNITRKEEEPQYVEIVDPLAPEISFVKSKCPERKVIRVICDHLQCGVASARGASASKGVDGLSRSAQPGDWPWHAALLRTHVHACDAALIHPSWLVTTESCFQGQPKAEWTARFGTVRIQSTTPWQQERRIVGMVRSPVEGSMLALVRLEEPVETTDFVRPICLSDDGVNADKTICNTLGWTRNRDQLQRVHVISSPMNTCENVSIATVNGICAEPLYDQDDCDAAASTSTGSGGERRDSLISLYGAFRNPVAASRDMIYYYISLTAHTSESSYSSNHAAPVPLPAVVETATSNYSLLQEEEYAGSAMMCFDKQTKHWSLMGVSGWRIACTKIGLGRPRIYDSIASHVDWIRRTISNSAR